MLASCPDSQTRKFFKYVVIGGGIAGVTCVQMLSQLCPDELILLITASCLIKIVSNVRQVTEMIQDFDVKEEPPSQLEAECLNVSVVQVEVASLDAENKVIHTIDGTHYLYEKLCLCAGATPKLLNNIMFGGEVITNKYVLGIRDTETVKIFQKKLTNATRIMVVGNGGIATELVYQIEGCEVIWAIKDASISCVFIDPVASDFLLPDLNKPKKTEKGPLKRMAYTLQADAKDDQQPSTSSSAMGSALGPDWSTKLPIHGADSESHRITVEYSVEVERLFSAPELEQAKQSAKIPLQIHDNSKVWPVYVELSNGKIYGCDFVVSATGIQPCTQVFIQNNKFDIAEDGGIKVNNKMQTSVNDIYAAGDICTASWEPAPHWLQMRLWNQARQMGAYSAQCMVADSNGEESDLDICFELFTHITKFFGYKIVLLGRFNAQDLEQGYEILLRITEGVEYVKAILKDGRMQGAILIGETDLEEVFENLILNQTNLVEVKDALLDPMIDIEDYFD